MNQGSKVVFIYPWNGYTHDQKQAEEHLKVGQTYTVKRVHEHDWRTDIELVEVPTQRFNSVLLRDADDLPTLAQYARCLSPSVGHPGTEKTQHKAHEAALEWLAARLEEV